MHRAPDYNCAFNSNHLSRVREVIHRALKGQWSIGYLDEDDLVVEAAEHVAERLHRFNESGSASLNTWIEKVATNCLRDIIDREQSKKRGRGWRSVSLDEALPGGGILAALLGDDRPTPHDSAARAQQVRDLDRWIETLTSEHRKTVLALYRAPTHRDAARSLGIAPGSLYSRIGTLAKLAEDAGLRDWL